MTTIVFLRPLNRAGIYQIIEHMITNTDALEHAQVDLNLASAVGSDEDILWPGKRDAASRKDGHDPQRSTSSTRNP